MICRTPHHLIIIIYNLHISNLQKINEVYESTPHNYYIRIGPYSRSAHNSFPGFAIKVPQVNPAA